MDSIKPYMKQDHAHCDALFINTETAVAHGDWPQATLAWTEFSDALERHLQMEEEVLFPAFEEALASKEGPTAVMRIEHRQIRDMADSISRALQQQNLDQFSGDADTLTILLQQHNRKEEEVLYVMMDRVLADRRTELLAAMDAIHTAIP